MNVKTFKRMSKRFLSSLLSVLMVLSLLTVCAVGSTVTAGAWNSIGGYTITVQTSGWSDAFFFVGSDSYTFVYDMSSTGTSGEFSVTIPSSVNWNDGGYFFFSKTNYGLSDGGGTSTGASGVRSNLINGGYTCSALVSRNTTEIEDGNTYVVASDGTVTVGTGGGGTSSGSYFVPATLFNYRTTDQITAASSVTEDTLEKSYDIDKTNGQASPWNSYANGTYSAYNKAVSDWYSDTTDVTPLYQGNFHDQTLPSSPPYHNFMKLANAANRYDGNDGASTKSVAQGLVDDVLNPDGNITQGGKEMPQFSKLFMETANEDDVIQTVYENLKFEVNTETRGSNTWYTYDAATDGNRSIDVENSLIKNWGNTVYSTGTDGKQSSNPGYFPFNKSQPGDPSDITNSFGTRFDITFVMTKDGTLNGEDLQFTFTGDDDLWVFIDGYLALDMGGSHNKASGTINLNTDNMYTNITTGRYDATYVSGDWGDVSATPAYDGAQPLDGRIVTSLKDTTKEHTMTIFYMERGMFDSNLAFEFLLPQTNSFTIEQKVDYSNVNSGLLEQTLLTADFDAFSFDLNSDSASATSNETAEIPVTQTLERANAAGKGTVFQVGNAEAENPTGIPFDNFNDDEGGIMSDTTNTTFVWKDTNTSLDGQVSSTGTGTGKVDTNGNVNLLYNQSAIFNDQFTSGSTLQFKQNDALNSFELDFESEEPPTVSSNKRLASDYYTTALSVTDYAGRTLTPTEDDNGYQVISFANQNGESPNNVKMTATYTNTIKTGDIQFTKDLSEGETYENTTQFEFEVQFKEVFGGTNDTWTTYPIDYTIDSGSATQDFNLGVTNTINIKIGDTVIISGVPVGTEYRIVEVGEDSETLSYSVDEVVNNSANANTVQNLEDTTGGIIATVGTVESGSNVAAFSFKNTTQETMVVYRFVDRKVTTGLPTSMEDQYTYFTRQLPGTSPTVEDVKKYAPTIKNVLKTYTLEDANITLEHELTAEDIANCEGATNLQSWVGQKVILATYTPVDRTYTVNFTYMQYDYPDDGITPENTGKLVSRSFEKKWNELMQFSDLVDTMPEYTDENGTHKFMYWAKLVDVDGGDSANKIYTPISTDFSYAYRVTDNADIIAVYDTDAEFTQLDAPTVTDGESYHVTGDKSGYDASAAEKIYDSYSVDTSDGEQQDRTRVNIGFGSVGSKDVDNDIQKVGYILIKSSDGYAKDSQFTDDLLKTQLEENTARGSIKDKDGNEYTAQIRLYENVNKVDYVWGETNDWTPYYTAGQINLTNKNRLNFVFDIKNNETTQQYSYTCYTVMVRNGETYISNTPAFFNLKEADPLVVDTVVDADSYKVIAGVNDTQLGTISVSKSYVKDLQPITITINPTPYTNADGYTVVSTLESLEFGSLVIDTEAEFTAYKLSTTGTSTTEITFQVSDHLAEVAKTAGTLKIKANFVGTVNANSVLVTQKECTNGVLKVGSSEDGTFNGSVDVAKNGTFYVQATPNNNYEFSHWADDTSNTNPIRKVTLGGDNGLTYTMPEPVFVIKQYDLKLTANEGGTITYTYGTTTGTVATKTTETITVDAGTEVTLTANVTTDGASFYKWSDSNTSETRTVTVDTDKSLTARFNLPVTNNTIYVADMAGWGSVYYQYANNTGWKQLTAETDEYEKNGTTYPMYKIENVPSDVNWFNFTKNLVNGGANSDYYLNPSGEVENGHVFEITGPKSWTTSNISDWTGGSIDPTDPTDPTDPVTTSTIYIAVPDGNTMSWGTPYVHIYGTDTGNLNDWGATASKATVMYSGQLYTDGDTIAKIYKFEYTDNSYDTVMIHNNAGNKTDKLTLTPGNIYVLGSSDTSATSKAYSGWYKYTAPTTRTIYLQTGVWNDGGAWFEAYFWNSSGATGWYTMTDTDGDGTYTAEIGTEYTGIKFYRKGPGVASKQHTTYWDAAGDYTISDNGNNKLVVNGWNNYSWS